MPTLKQYYGDYTDDVVFVRGQGYMTQRQQKQQKREERAKRDARRQAAAARNPAPAPVPVPATAPVPLPERGTPEGGMTPIRQLPGEPPLDRTGQESSTPPPWWINTAYTNPNAQQSFANAANAILPTLSPEDQRNMAMYLSTNFKDVFGGYANANFAPIPTQLTDERQTYFNPDRARAALNLLNRVQSVAGGEPGKGYDFLKQALDALNKYSTPGQPMTREQYELFANAIKDMSAQAGGDISAYGNLAQMFNLPGFTAGQPFSNAPIPRLNV